MLSAVVLRNHKNNYISDQLDDSSMYLVVLKRGVMWLWSSFVCIKVVGDLLQNHSGKCFSSGKNMYLVRLQ